jgi:hypothetical protein
MCVEIDLNPQGVEICMRKLESARRSIKVVFSSRDTKSTFHISSISRARDKMTSKPLSLAGLATRRAAPYFPAIRRVFLCRYRSMNLRAMNPVLRRQIRPRNKSLRTNDWVCKSCRTKPPPRVRPLSTRTSAKPYYITTPIFYVNAGVLRFLVVGFVFNC